MVRRIGTALLACAPLFSGEALAMSSHRNWSGPTYQCYWEGTRYAPGGYCVGRSGVVQVCTSSGDWMSIGPCLGDECRVVCPAG